MLKFDDIRHELLYTSIVSLCLCYTRAARKKKIRVLTTEVKPISFWLLVQMLYHLARTGGSWELTKGH